MIIEFRHFFLLQRAVPRHCLLISDSRISGFPGTQAFDLKILGIAKNKKFSTEMLSFQSKSGSILLSVIFQIANFFI